MFPGLSPTRLLCVVAHPDDETFGCGSTLLRADAEGIATAVCCATRGEAGEPVPGFEVPSEGLGHAREAELREAALLLGVGRVDVLDHRDSGMGDDLGSGTLVAAGADRLLADLRVVADGFEPDVLLSLDAADGHRDHAVARDATIALGRERDLPVFLQALPRSLMRRWLDHMRTVSPELPYLEMQDLGTPDEQIDLELDNRAHLATREKAIALHRSQSSPYDNLPADLREAFLAADHLIRAV